MRRIAGPDGVQICRRGVPREVTGAPGPSRRILELVVWPSARRPRSDWRDLTPPDTTSLNDAYERSAFEFAQNAHRLVYAPLARPLIAAVTALAGGHPGGILD